jgi:hypothetical protein
VAVVLDWGASRQAADSHGRDCRLADPLDCHQGDRCSAAGYSPVDGRPAGYRYGLPVVNYRYLAPTAPVACVADLKVAAPDPRSDAAVAVDPAAQLADRLGAAREHAAAGLAVD